MKQITQNSQHKEVEIKNSSYRFFVGQQLFPDPEEVLAELSQAFNEALLQFFTEEEKEKQRGGGLLSVQSANLRQHKCTG